jgi:hypothetical protein
VTAMPYGAWPLAAERWSMQLPTLIEQQLRSE